MIEYSVMLQDLVFVCRMKNGEDFFRGDILIIVPKTWLLPRQINSASRRAEPTAPSRGLIGLTSHTHSQPIDSSGTNPRDRHKMPDSRLSWIRDP
jgi:hypothetical protein